MMEENNIRRDSFTYSLLTRIAMRHNDADLAFQVASAMREAKIPFDSHIYTTLIKLAAIRKDFDVCEQLIARMETQGGVDCMPDAKSYRTVIIEMIRADRCELERALKLMEKMMASTICPDVDTTYWVLSGLFSSGAVNEAWDLSSKIRKLQGHLHNHTHNQLMWEFLWRGDTSRCEELLDRAEAVSPELTVFDFTHVFSKVAEKRGGDPYCAAYVLSRMLQLKLKPTLEIFQHLAKIYSNEFGWVEGEERTNEEIARATKHLLKCLPSELFSVPMNERIARRERKEKFMSTISSPRESFDNEEDLFGEGGINKRNENSGMI